MQSRLHRTEPLVIRRGIRETTLAASEVNLLIEGAQELARGARNAHDQRQVEDDHLREHLDELLHGHVSELTALAEELASASPSPQDPPMDVTRAQGRLIRQVMSDLSGYQRRDLTTALRQLRQILSGQ
jgi:hypothetical protein